MLVFLSFFRGTVLKLHLYMDSKDDKRSSEGVSQGSKDGATAMSGGTDANMMRSVQLQEEWGTLRGEMDALVSEMAAAPAPTEDQVRRKESLAGRMTVITQEMTDILARAQEKLPPTPSHPGYCDEETGPPVRSKTGKHRIERTYDSSDSDGNPPPSRVNQEITLLDVDASDGENLNEKPSVRVGNDRTVLTTLGTKLRSTLQKAQNTLGTSAGPGISEEEKEALKLEESRLEREVRSLKRNGEDHNSDRMEEITKRLKEIADLTLDNGAASPDEKGADTTSSGNLKAKARAFATTLSGHGKDKDKDEGATKSGRDAGAAPDGGDDSLPTRKKSMMQKAETTGKKAAQGFSKKWGTFRSAVGKKISGATGKNKEGGSERGGASSSNNPNTPPSATNTKSGGSATGSARKTNKTAGSPSTVQNTAGGSSAVPDEFNQVKQRLAQRGEKLEGVADETAAMREDATDFLAAARALRKKNEKKGLFT